MKYLVLVLLVVGCVNATVTTVDPTPRQPTASVVDLPEEPKRDYTLIAYVQSSSSSYDVALRAAQKKAATLGADALVLVRDLEGAGTTVTGVHATVHKYIWKAIVFR